MDIKQKVREFLGRHIQMTNVNDEDNYFERNLVNSLFAMQLVTFLERDFRIIIENDELSIENFQNVSAVVSFVERKLLQNTDSTERKV